MKLNTLREVGQSKRICCSIEEDYSNICEKCSRQEAIKWVKEWLRYRKVDKKEFFKVMEYALKHTGDNWKDFVFDASKSPNEDIIYEFDMVEFPIRFYEIKEEELK